MPGRGNADFVPAAAGARPSRLPWPQFAQMVRDVADYCRTYRRLPDEVWIGTARMSPADYLATLARAFQDAIGSAGPPASVPHRCRCA